jgi:outer membrane lipoprotein-sorting protein
MAKIFNKPLLCALSIVTAAGIYASMPAFAGAPVSDAAKKSMNFNPEGQLVEQMKDGASFIETMYKEIERLNDYSLLFSTKSFKKDSSITDAGKLYFKKPKMMRVEETGEYNKGSVAVITKDGTARAKGGGLAGLVVLTLKPSDKMLDAANGDKMEDSDFASLVRILKERIKSGHATRVSEKPVTGTGVPEASYVLELFKPSEPKVCLKRVWVHPVSYLPVRWDDYDYKDPCMSTWKDVKTNVGLSDELFKL